MNEWLQWTNVWMLEGANSLDDCIHAWIQWMQEWINEYMNEWIYEWMHE